MKDPRHVIIRPCVTEKGYALQEKYKQYAFEVATDATKSDIKRAIEQIFEVKVLAVNTLKKHGKRRRVRYKTGRTRNWKKAIISINREQSIDVF